MKGLSIILLVLFCLPAFSIHISDSKTFLDESGRQIIFRGPNVVVKVPPYAPDTDKFSADRSFSKEDIKMAKEWGFNGIRLGLMWAGVEPKKDQYNETYLKIMVDLVNEAGRNGIYTLIDFHQDIMAEKFCGDGVPTWLIDELGLFQSFPFPLSLKTMKLNTSHLPDWKDCNSAQWAKYHFSYDVARTFASLYTRGHRLNTKFNQYWVKLAETFKDNPYVIAYELINEPWGGNEFRDPLLLVPSMGERLKLQNFYDQLAQNIREVDPKAKICFEPVTYDNNIPTGFSHPPGGQRYENLSIFCYHYYKPPSFNLSTIDQRISDAHKLNTASLLSEFHGHEPQISYIDKYRQGWLFWGYKSFGKNWGSYGEEGVLGSIFNPNGTPNEDQIRRVSRTYMQKTAGRLIDMSYNSTSKHFMAFYEAEPNGESVLFLSRGYNYPKDPELTDISAVPAELTEVTEDEWGYVTIRYKGGKRGNVLVTVELI